MVLERLLGLLHLKNQQDYVSIQINLHQSDSIFKAEAEVATEDCVFIRLNWVNTTSQSSLHDLWLTADMKWRDFYRDFSSRSKHFVSSDALHWVIYLLCGVEKMHRQMLLSSIVEVKCWMVKSFTSTLQSVGYHGMMTFYITIFSFCTWFDCYHAIK